MQPKLSPAHVSPSSRGVLAPPPASFSGYASEADVLVSQPLPQLGLRRFRLGPVELECDGAQVQVQVAGFAAPRSVIPLGTLVLAMVRWLERSAGRCESAVEGLRVLGSTTGVSLDFSGNASPRSDHLLLIVSTPSTRALCVAVLLDWFPAAMQRLSPAATDEPEATFY